MFVPLPTVSTLPSLTAGDMLVLNGSVFEHLPLATPALSNAARTTIKRRINQPDREDSEWSRANLVNYYARLLDEDAAHVQLLGLVKHAAEDNLLTYSCGGVAGAATNFFSLDGNTAGAAGIAEMLLQSHANELHLLLGLPAAWPTGSIRGQRARGDIEVNLQWDRGKLVNALLKSVSIRRVLFVTRHAPHP